MKIVTKLVALLLVVLITAAPLSSLAAYANSQIDGHSIRYEATKNSTDPQGYASLRVTQYGSVPDPTLAGLEVILCCSDGTPIVSNNQPSLTVKTHSFTLSVSVGTQVQNIGYAVGPYYYTGVEWYYSSTGSLVMYHGSFD